MGRQRRAGRRRRPLHHLHADVLFRQRLRRSARELDWARPFAITGQVGYAIPGSNATVTVDPDTGDVDTEFNPRVLVWGASLQYSLPYLKSAVVDLGLPDFVNHLIPLVEASLQTPVCNTFDLRHGDHRHHQSRRDLGRRQIPGRRRGDDPGQPAERQQRRRHRADCTSSSTTFSPTPSAGRFSATASHQGGRPSATSHETSIARSLSLSPHPAARRRACACHARPCQPARRQHGRHRAEELHAVVHRKTGAGLLHRRGAQRARRGAERQGARRPAATAPSCACR